jgi:hypothetical protein
MTNLDSGFQMCYRLSAKCVVELSAHCTIWFREPPLRLPTNRRLPILLGYALAGKLRTPLSLLTLDNRQAERLLTRRVT